MAASHTADDDRALATLNADGSRRWLKPRVSKGRFLTARRVVAYLLILLFTAIPYIRIGGDPLLLLDIARREFVVFGRTFLPTDTALMASLMVIIFVSVFLVTALFGRVWCGWACPQTVYMEFLYRPIERLFEGAPGRKRNPSSAGIRKVGKYVVFLLCSLFLAHTFLAYFVGVERLARWVTQSPIDHPTAFLVMAATTGLMMFDFCFFREQTCLVACPYGRFQAALLDRQSLIVTYDKKRGEPRGKMRKRPKSADVSLPVMGEEPAPGDCIDCHMCVTTCPTGIDIREGLQMECIGCAQCIDACDAVMEKIGRPRGLIRYSSQAAVEGERVRLLRPRVILYPLVLLVFVGIFLTMLGSREAAEAAVLPRQGAPFYTLPDGTIANQVRLRVVNRGEAPAMFSVSVSGVEGAVIEGEHTVEGVAPAESETLGFAVSLPADAFDARGGREVTLIVTDGGEFEKELTYRVLGPAGRSGPARDAEGGGR